ncbi:hypothetical protein N0V88_004087 [Collariella sp. IMI 366227]|nr:hypothetical protein N0V88_004087 [Collariella sp. IMI 366227]
MSPSRPTTKRRSRYSSRPVVSAALLLTIIVALALFQSTPGIASRRGLETADIDCRKVHSADDQCAFILANCEDDEAGLIHYLSFYYCAPGHAKLAAFALLAAWLGLLFTTIGIAASDFFSINLSTISSALGLSESLAGVTFLAFGNGSPDVFSTFAAMGSNSGSMAVGELIGAAGFITAVVAGSMALVREFKVSKRTFVRDIVFFIGAISFTMVFLADGELHMWECFTMIGYYVFYVLVVVGWHWYTTRRKGRRMRDVASRTNFYGPSGRDTDELEPYRDEPDDDDTAPVGSRRDPEPGDISVLERGPRIEVDGGLSESPGVLTPYQEQPGFALPGPLDTRRHSFSFPGLDGQDEHPRPVKWWPYRFLPPPHVLLSTFFPTLQEWKDKSLWDKIVSLISVPSIFFLVATLPVVETDSEHDESEPDVADPPDFGHPGNTAPPVAVADDGEIQSETEWQAYRRRTRSVNSRSPISMSPSSMSLNIPHPAEQQPLLDFNVELPQLPKPAGVDPDTITTTSAEPAGWNRWLVAVQLFTGPIFVVFVIWANTAEDYEEPKKTLLQMVLYSLLASLCLLAVLILTTSVHKKPKYHFLLCFLGFIISVAWISTIAGEVVGVLKAFGVILDISEAILGLTVFAVGNSLGDLVADVTVARLGYPVMALAACFGGPMLNILLGVGVGGAWMSIKSADKRHHKHPDSPLHYKPYRVHVGRTLMISAVTVLLTLVILLIVVPSNNWIMSRKIGWGLIGIWTVGTIVNLVVEMTGALADVS